MQEIKTLHHRVMNTALCLESDAKINVLLADGWTILTSAIATTSEDADSYLTMVLVRESQPAPSETPRTDGYLIDDRVMVREGHSLAGMVGSVRDVFGGRSIGHYEVELDDDNGLHVIAFADLDREPNDDIAN